MKTAYEARLEEARAAAEGAARLMRDTAGSETGLAQRVRGDGRPAHRIAGGAGPPRRPAGRHGRGAGRLAPASHGAARADRRRTSPARTWNCWRRLPSGRSAAWRRSGPSTRWRSRSAPSSRSGPSFLAEQRRDLEASLAELQQVITDLDEHIETSFGEIFEVVKENFSAVIATVFPGAKGSLKLVEGAAARADEGAPGEEARGRPQPRRPSRRSRASAWRSSSPTSRRAPSACCPAARRP